MIHQLSLMSVATVVSMVMVALEVQVSGLVEQVGSIVFVLMYGTWFWVELLGVR